MLIPSVKSAENRGILPQLYSIFILQIEQGVFTITTLINRQLGRKIQRILHAWSFYMKFMKRAIGEFHKFHIRKAKSVRFCLSYDPLNYILTPMLNYFSRRKRVVDMDVVIDATYTRQSVITRVVIRFL